MKPHQNSPRRNLTIKESGIFITNLCNASWKTVIENERKNCKLLCTQWASSVKRSGCFSILAVSACVYDITHICRLRCAARKPWACASHKLPISAGRLKLSVYGSENRFGKNDTRWLYSGKQYVRTFGYQLKSVWSVVSSFFRRARVPSVFFRNQSVVLSYFISTTPMLDVYCRMLFRNTWTPTVQAEKNGIANILTLDYIYLVYTFALSVGPALYQR